MTEQEQPKRQRPKTQQEWVAAFHRFQERERERERAKREASDRQLADA